MRKTMRMLLYTASGDCPPNPAAAALPKTAAFLDAMQDPGDDLPGWLSGRRPRRLHGASSSGAGFRGGLKLVPQHRPELGAEWRAFNRKKVTPPSLFVSGRPRPRGLT